MNTTLTQKPGNISIKEKPATLEYWYDTLKNMNPEIREVIEKMLEKGTTNAEIAKTHQKWAQAHPTIL